MDSDLLGVILRTFRLELLEKRRAKEALYRREIEDQDVLIIEIIFLLRELQRKISLLKTESTPKPKGPGGPGPSGSGGSGPKRKMPDDWCFECNRREDACYCC